MPPPGEVPAAAELYNPRGAWYIIYTVLRLKEKVVDMKPFFSIVMACCDVEPYIRESLDSVMKQSFGSWECICGIEESKDKTGEIIREIAASEPRIRFFDHPRSGSC